MVALFFDLFFVVVVVFLLLLQEFCRSQGLFLFYSIIYVLMNVGLFLWAFLKYKLASPQGPAITYEAYLALGDGICFARGAAAALRFNCALVLLPVLRNSLRYDV